nr:linear amide C-N hydrolase [Desulfovibrio sp. UIB00]
MLTNRALAAAVIASSLCLGLNATPASACSRILFNHGPHHVVARTMDLYIPDHAKIVVYPQGMERNGAVTVGQSHNWISKYGSVTVSSLGAGTSDGINEKGFVANLLYLHETKYEARDNRPGVSNAMVLQFLLDTSASVKEALESLNKTQVVSEQVAGRTWPLHISISDASGDSAVIEFVDGTMVVHHGSESNVMTNEPPLAWQLNNMKRYKYFGGSESLPGDIDPASRFLRASAFLKTTPAPKDTRDALAMAYGIAKTVSVPKGSENTSSMVGSEDTWPTLWTTLADSTNLYYFFQAAESPNMFWVDLSKINFAKGSPVLSVSGEDHSLNGEISAKLVQEKR